MRRRHSAAERTETGQSQFFICYRQLNDRGWTLVTKHQDLPRFGFDDTSLSIRIDY